MLRAKLIDYATAQLAGVTPYAGKEYSSSRWKERGAQKTLSGYVVDSGHGLQMLVGGLQMLVAAYRC